MPLFNGTRSDYAPAFMGQEAKQIYFTTTRQQVTGDEISGITGMKNGDIFFSSLDEKGKWKAPEQVKGVNTDFDEGACAFSADGKTMYLTVCRTDPQYPRMAEIWTSDRADAAWGNPEKVGLLMRSYARNLATQASLETIAADMQANEPKKMDTDTVSSYISALAKLFVVEESKAWNPNLRSKTAIRTSNTRYYTDPSIGTASLSIGPKDLENDLNTFGYFFETLAIRDLRTYAEALMGEVAHYRDADKLECDAVVHLRDGRYGLIEIKLGGEALIKEGVKSLTALKNKLDTTKMNKPSFLMVLTGVGSIAYRRPEDGIYVVPIGCLKP